MATSYDRHSTASDIASDLSSNIAGKVILTTGVSPRGLGAHFVETIAQHKPALIILAGRSESKIQATVDKIASNPASADVPTRILILNLDSQEQIREAAKEVLAYKENIDVLVNSAGLVSSHYVTTKEGIESHFGSNHIAHFLFTNLILPKLLASPHPRVVCVASDGHRTSGVRFDDVNFQDGKVYSQWRAYGQSKTANILFSKALAEKLGPRGLKTYSLHPGVVFGTSLAAAGVGEKDFADLKAIDIENQDVEFGKENAVFDVKTLDECAATHVVAAFDPSLEDHNGAYLTDGNLAKDWQLRPTARNPGDAEKLWKLSEQLVGQKFEY
ncbi:NAD(P)-binding protein [Amniculicola lignicola CBS 123094]|uniref:NAD(P)-binding protein n=1 Tax=Amniculicola lignicola CBS 123094 TaxID=1392246 RepID=A0A6A5WEJ8_9PLEO|nr:NAD(P)-binding protein [Amniculicola lignicola CBS 123094]